MGGAWANLYTLGLFDLRGSFLYISLSTLRLVNAWLHVTQGTKLNQITDSSIDLLLLFDFLLMKLLLVPVFFSLFNLDDVIIDWHSWQCVCQLSMSCG